ncbi:MAG: hypothetical protein HY646_05975 [Acidobacteria bacterium]|nr:hypothetical protein [Acidobacteriota bacterium]
MSQRLSRRVHWYARGISETKTSNEVFMTGLGTVAKTRSLKAIVDTQASNYFHSKPLIEQETPLILEQQKLAQPINLQYSIKELLLVGAITHSSVLITGDTDLGKTTLAKLVMNAVFGNDGWHKINVDIEYTKDMAVSTDFGAMVGGKTSEQLYTVYPWLGLPGLITDEINRGHSKVVNSLMHFFDREINLPNGQKAKIGYEYEPGKHYQFQIAAINEGEEYSGTFDIDKAMRRRTIIEIPMNNFTTTPIDRRLVRRRASKELVLPGGNNHIEDVLSIYRALDAMEVHPNADLFLAFLEAFDYCEHSLTREKKSIPAKGGSIYHVCTKPVHGANTVCRFIKSFENELCPYISGITPGISQNLVSVAKGLAVLRAVKVGEVLHAYAQGVSPKVKNPETFESTLQQYAGNRSRGRDLAKLVFTRYVHDLSVRPEDIEAVFCFVAYSKIGLSAAWVAKHYQGNRIEAVRSFVRQAKEKFEEGVAKIESVDIHGVVGSGLAQDHRWTNLRQYCEVHNPWFWKAMTPYVIGNDGSQTFQAGQPSRLHEPDYLYQE